MLGGSGLCCRASPGRGRPARKKKMGGGKGKEKKKKRRGVPSPRPKPFPARREVSAALTRPSEAGSCSQK